MSVATFKMRFYPLYLKSHAKFTFLMSAILNCKLRRSWGYSWMGPDLFVISIQKLPDKPMSC